MVTGACVSNSSRIAYKMLFFIPLLLAALAPDTNAFVPATRSRANIASQKNNYGPRSCTRSSLARTATSSTYLSMSNDPLIVPDIDPSGLSELTPSDISVPPEINDAVKSMVETITSLSFDLPKEPLVLPDIDLSSLSLGDISMGDLSIPPEVNDAINSFIEWARPQVEALLEYVAADLNKYWEQYLAALEAKDSATIIGTGWGGLIFVLIVANTLARGGSEEKRQAAFEAAQAAKEEAAAKAAAKQARSGGLFGKTSANGPSRLQREQERRAAAEKRRAELEKKRFEARLAKKAKANKEAFDKKQKEKKRKEAQRRKILKADFQKRKGLGKNRK